MNEGIILECQCGRVLKGRDTGNTRYGLPIFIVEPCPICQSKAKIEGIDALAEALKNK